MELASDEGRSADTQTRISTTVGEECVPGEIGNFHSNGRPKQEQQEAHGQEYSRERFKLELVHRLIGGEALVLAASSRPFIGRAGG